MNKTPFQVFFQLLKRDLTIFMREYRTKLLDTVIMFATNVLIFSYFMTGQGLSESYGPFLLVAAIGTFGLIEVIGKVGVILSDFEGDRAISQLLMMPIRSEFVFIYIALFWAISSTLLAALLFPIGKLLLWNRFELSAISYVRLIPIFISGNLFFGAFGLWLTSIIPSISNLNTIWLRYIAPLWMFGGYFFSWGVVNKLHPYISMILLANPVIYVTEGMRAACLDQGGSLPYWVCLVVIWGFTFACTAHAIKRLKKTLDCI